MRSDETTFSELFFDTTFFTIKNWSDTHQSLFQQSPLLLGQTPSTPADHWMGFVNRARNRREQNLVAFQLGNRIFYEVSSYSRRFIAPPLKKFY